MKLLLIEDDKKIASYIANGLKESGFVVDVVHEGTEGLHLAQNGSYDAAIVDIMLPGMDGLSLIERLQIWIGKPIIQNVIKPLWFVAASQVEDV